MLSRVTYYEYYIMKKKNDLFWTNSPYRMDNEMYSVPVWYSFMLGVVWKQDTKKMH